MTQPIPVRESSVHHCARNEVQNANMGKDDHHYTQAPARRHGHYDDLTNESCDDVNMPGNQSCEIDRSYVN